MKIAGRILVTYLLLTLLFTGAMVLAFCIPVSAVEGNVRQSVRQVIDDGPMFTAGTDVVHPWELDVFSDCLLLGISYCADSSHPLQSSMKALFMMKDGSTIEGAELMLNDSLVEKPPLVVYSRYWHGNQSVLRPLLCVMTVHGIRWLNIVLLAGLLLAVTMALWRRVGRAEALIIMFCLLAVMLPSVPLCMNMVPTFYIALVSSLVILLWHPAALESRAVILFFVIGAFTAFYDLLTTPMIAMAVPMAVYILYHKPEKPCRTLIILALAWLAGYALLWATKWLLASLITGTTAFEDAFGSIAMRTVGRDEHDYMLWCLERQSVIVVVACLFAVMVTFLFGRSWESLRRHVWLLLLAMSGIVWIFVLLQHTWHHLFFTWRTLVVPLMCLALYWHQTLQFRRPLALFSHRE